MHTPRSLRLALAAPALAVALTACSGSGTVTASGTAQPAGVATTTATTTTTKTTAPAAPTSSAAPAPSSAGSSSSSAGCSPHGSVPGGAGRATTADLDGDGAKDQIWLADSGSTRRLGVRTASGAVFSTTFTAAAPQAASAVAGVVGGVPIVLLDTGRSVSLYAVHDCAIVKTRNPQGEQYTFDKGFTGYGTGVGCPEIGSARRLAGYDAKAVSGGRFDVSRTLITLSDGGARAANGSRTTIGTGLRASNADVKTAQSVSCGASGRAEEPQS